MNRRHFLQSSTAATAGLLAPQIRVLAQGGRKPRILLRSSWQVVNIGDIAHTPGVLALLQKYIPEAEVRLWASGDLSKEVMDMEHVRFPGLPIVKGSIGENGKAAKPELQEALEWCDFLLHGSGPGFVAAADVAAFAKYFQKPYGVYGITYGTSTPEMAAVLTGAKFLFFRDSVSLAKAKADGLASPIMEFGPDGAFACDLQDDARALPYLKEHGLEKGKFLCVIPRYRATPYWTIPNKKRAYDEKKDARNQAMKEVDHAKLREAIVAVLKGTDMKIFICPEDMTQVAIGKEMLVDKLPAEFQDRIVWKCEYWLTAEALSVYRQSAGMFGFEMHSPIMCIGNGIPAIVCRFKEQTSKGLMWKDIGLGDWLFDLDEEPDGSRIAAAALSLVKDPEGTKAKVAKAKAYVEQRQRETMAVVKASVPVVSLAAR